MVIRYASIHRPFRSPFHLSSLFHTNNTTTAATTFAMASKYREAAPTGKNDEDGSVYTSARMIY
jgi:hypothetical protein